MAGWVVPVPQLSHFRTNQYDITDALTISLPHNRLAKPEDNVLIGIMYSVETGEEDLLGHNMEPGLTDISFLSGIMGLRVLKTPEAFRTRTNFHVSEVSRRDGDGLMEPLGILMPLKHA